MNSSICIVIENYNDNDNALYLMGEFRKRFDYVFVVDSGSVDPHWAFHRTDVPFAVGNFNKATQLFLGTKCEGCMYICSDVQIESDMVERMSTVLSNTPSDVGCWTPAVNGRSHDFLKPIGSTGLRDIPFAEGMIRFAKRIVMEHDNVIYPIVGMKHGGGHDVYIGYVASKKLGLRVVIDESCQVYHPPGTRYSVVEGTREMYEFIGKREPEYQQYIADCLGIDPFNYEEMLKDWNDSLNK